MLHESVVEESALAIAQKRQTHIAPPFGQSLHVDLYGVSKAICDDLSFCYQLLEDLTNLLNMHKQAPPFIFRSPDDQFPDKAGLSGWVPLIESGMSIHTLTLRRFVSLDIYTCGDLNIEETIAFLYERLQAESHEQHYLVRGVMYHAAS
ncbi:S-adenosylmethionine decarboxylase family protein [Thermocoleostomius sinensis]|uniref:S-adenosylmethionine decarboxylase n=1 Tax=Thermocoleostomius sinensis A174 TaxID=2016057 RepID=A0A9E9CB69_9CYAN|nr:S-adenosylmethionine decarboxylase [Thermocoleostomius sinensis]WAL61907.1 S-adenosylmethionine decarboxylase [Thermocoleostomius sinensis A174]